MKPITSTTQNFLDIEDIVADLLILKDGSACMVLLVSAINFDLLSEREQDATIFAYAQLLNSLTFSVQIVVTSKQKDISDYVKLLEERLTQVKSPLLYEQMNKYRDFIKSIVRQGNVLDKKFYVVIPFSSLELGTKAAISVLGNRSGLPAPKIEIAQRSTINLAPKRDHLIRQFARIGLKARQLTSEELLQEFFNYYNRDLAGTKVNMPQV
jgi:hypothetical protein